MLKQHPLSTNELRSESDKELQERVQNTMKHMSKLTTPEEFIKKWDSTGAEYKLEDAFREYGEAIIEACMDELKTMLKVECPLPVHRALNDGINKIRSLKGVK